MPRQARKVSELNIYHVILRGINRQIIFEEDTLPPVRYLGEVNNYWGGQYKSNWKWVNPFGV